MVSIVDGTEAVALTAADLQAMGFSLAFYALSALFSAVRAMEETLAVLRRDGTPSGRADAMTSYGAFADLVDLAGHQARRTGSGGEGRSRDLPRRSLDYGGPTRSVGSRR